MKKILSFIGVAMAFGALAVFNSCSDSDPEPTPQRDGNDITSFTLSSVSDIQEIVINPEDATVKIHVAADFDLTTLVAVVPQINISAAATISPAASEARDFSKELTYVVTAENGTPKTWKVSPVVSTHVSKGFRAARDKWFTSYPESGAVENTAAVIGDYIIASRTYYGWNAQTGAAIDLKTMLNTEGLGEGNPGTMFVFTNDDAGNLVGCVLGAWSPDSFRVYLWTSIDAKPKELVNYPTSGTTISMGRKLVARGDLNNGSGYITAYNVNTSKTTADHYCWKFTNGTATGDPQIVSTSYADDNLLQMLIPATTSSVLPAYMVARGQAGANPPAKLSYFTLPELIDDGTIRGPLDETEDGVDVGDTGWGNYIIHGTRFEFNGNAYMAVLSYRTDAENGYKYYISVLDIDNDNAVMLKKMVAQDVDNGNFTGSISVKELPDAGDTKTMYLYAFMSGTGTVAYELSNLYNF